MRSILIITCLMATMFGAPAVAQQACPTLVVATNDDAVNGDTSSPCALIANPGPDGISLREALLAANNATGTGVVTVTFAGALAGTTIALTERFAPITRSQITLSGLTNNGQPNITLDATNAANPGSIFFIATSSFTMSGINVINIPTNFNGMQIGGSYYNLVGQPVSSPSQTCCFQITGNAFSNNTSTNTFAIFIPSNITGETISDVTIANNSFTRLGEAINIQGGGPGASNSIIQDVLVFGNTFSQMTLTATSAVEVGAGPTNDTVQRVQIVQNTFTDNFQGFVIDIGGNSSGNLVQDVTVARNFFSGGVLGIVAGDSNSNNNAVTNTQIVDNVVNLPDSGGATIQITDSQSGGTNDTVNGVSFVNNTIYNGSSASPPGWGLWVNNNIGGVTGVSATNTIFWGNESTPPLNGITSPSQVANSIIHQTGFSGVNNNIDIDPLFVNPGTGNFGLQAGSSAIGAGTSTGAPALDIACQPRASPPSIGAYELNGPNICASGPQTLLVNPTTNMSASGTQGGPFAPGSFQYQLSTSGGSIDYSISGLPNWLTASSVSGTLTASSPVTFTINANANGLTPGTYGPGTVTIANTTNGQGNTNPTATLVVNPAGFMLTVSDTGSGTVTSSPSGINCGSTCSATFSGGTQVTLNETPAAGWSFSGWGGACSGSGTCGVTMSAAQSVTATFAQVSYSLSVSVSGSGTVTSSPAGISCSPTCSKSFLGGTSVTLTAIPAQGAMFSGWGGACTGTGDCSLTINAAASVSASFATSAPPTPAARTFISAAGNDSNNCINVARPCRHFAAAYALTAANGEIYVLDPANYGSLTITGPVSIEGHGWASIAPVSGSAAITINATGATDKINIIGVVLDGTATATTTGILFNSGGSLNIRDSVIRNFTEDGVAFAPTSSGPSQLSVSNTLVSDNGANGINVDPSGSGAVNGVLDQVDMENNAANGLVISTTSQSINVTITDSASANNGGDGVLASSNNGTPIRTMVRNSTIANNGGYGFECLGTGATVLVTRSTITGNNTGWGIVSGGIVSSYGDNNIDDNGNANTEPPSPSTYH